MTKSQKVQLKIMKFLNRTRNAARSAVRSFSTDEVFRENEKSANRLASDVLMISAVTLLLTDVLNLTGYYDINPKLLYPLSLACLVVQLTSWILCRVYKGDKPWLKVLILLSMAFVYSACDCVLTFRTALVMVIPVVVSSRYYSRQVTVATALVTTLLFGLSASAGILFSFIDLNFVTVPNGTVLQVTDGLYNAVQSLNLDIAAQEHDILLASFLPKYFVFVLVACVSVNIADRGHAMILAQDQISKEHARVETELNVARSIQRRALPIVHTLPDHPEFDIAASMRPAKEVGGDFYDFAFIDPTHLALIMADVSGKGVPAALFMMVSKLLLDNCISSRSNPGRALTEVNHQLCEKNLEDMFVTVWLGVLDLETGRLVSANAGHENPAICRKGGSFELIKRKHGLVLGGFDGVRYKEVETMLEPGDTLFLYTDGIPEAVNPQKEQFGLDRTLESLNRIGTDSMDAILQGVQADIDRFAGSEPQFDDTTMLALRLNSYKHTTGLSIMPERGSIPAVAAYVEQELDKGGVALKDANKINIAVDELYTNVVEYSTANWASVVCEVADDLIRVTICDNGIPYDPLAKADPDTTLSADERQIGGLGIFMAKKLMSSLDYYYANGRNHVIMTLKRN